MKSQWYCAFIIAVLFADHPDTVASVLYVDVNSVSPTPPYATWTTAAAVLQDAVDAALPGDQVLVTNGVYSAGGRTVGTNLLRNRVTVEKAVEVRSLNGPAFTAIKGQQLSGTTNGPTAMRCVYLGNGAKLIGFTLTNGATLAVPGSSDASGGALRCASAEDVVSNCVLIGGYAYETGGNAFSGTLLNCTITLGVAGIGGGTYDCVLSNCTVKGCTSETAAGGVANCSAYNCTLSENASSGNGGGAWSSFLANCKLNGNISKREGGGAWGSALNNCLVSSNSAATGGGTAESSLTNCTVVYNWATDTGGVWLDKAVNSIVYYNSASNGVKDIESPLGVNYCCTMPIPQFGNGNFTNEPAFVNESLGNFQLQSNSPCINAGNNAFVTTSVDQDGNPRIKGGVVDVGAFEFQSPSSILSYAWLQQYGLPSDGSADFADPDGDGMNNWQEWVAGTDPTDAKSVFKMLNLSLTASGVDVRWQSVTNRSYCIERSTNLAGEPRFTVVATNIVGQPGATVFSEMRSSNPCLILYRVHVHQ